MMLRGVPSICMPVDLPGGLTQGGDALPVLPIPTLHQVYNYGFNNEDISSVRYLAQNSWSLHITAAKLVRHIVNPYQRRYSIYLSI